MRQDAGPSPWWWSACAVAVVVATVVAVVVPRPVGQLEITADEAS